MDMTEMPEELRRLIEKERVPAEEESKSTDDQLIEDVAHLLYPLSLKESPRITQDRADFMFRYRRQVARQAFIGGDDVLLDQLRALRQQQNEAYRRIRLLLAYARTTPPKGRKYRLRDLSEATELPISSIRDLITDAELREIERLDLDGERAEELAKKLPRFDQE